MTKNELVKEVARETGIPESKVKSVIDATNARILKEVEGGGKVAFVGLWTFFQKKYPAKKGKIPGTDKTYETKESKGVGVKVSRSLRWETD